MVGICQLVADVEVAEHLCAGVERPVADVFPASARAALQVFRVA